MSQTIGHPIFAQFFSHALNVSMTRKGQMATTSVVIVEPTTKKLDLKYCKGTGLKATGKGKRKMQYSYYGVKRATGPLQYECPECGRRVSKVSGKKELARHVPVTANDRKKQEAALIAEFKDQGLVSGFCAGCDKMTFLPEGDFLCGECRE